MAHNRSTKSLSIDKRFTDVELNGGLDCSSGAWLLPRDLKVKGGALIFGNICPSEMDCFQNLNIKKNMNVIGNINGRIIKDVTLTNYEFPNPFVGGNIVQNNTVINGELIVKGRFTCNTLSIIQESSCACGNITPEVAFVYNDDGEALAFRPDDGLLYRFAGYEDPNMFMGNIHPTTLVQGTNLFPSTVVDSEFNSMIWYPPTNKFIGHAFGDMYSISPNGMNINKIGTTLGAEGTVRGMALVDGTRLFAVDNNNPNLYEISPSTAVILNNIPLMMSDGSPILGANAISTNPLTNNVYIAYKVGGGGSPRPLGKVDINTGIVTPVCGNVQTTVIAAMVFDNTGKLWISSGNNGTPANTLLSFAKEPCPIINVNSKKEYLGNCIVDNDTDTRVCVINATNSIVFDTLGNRNAQMNSAGGWQTGSGKAFHFECHAEGGSATNDYAHTEGWNNVGGILSHIEGGNNICNSPDIGLHIEGYNNKAFELSSDFPYVVVHVEGNSNHIYYGGANYNHIEGEDGNIGPCAFGMHVEGKNNFVYEACTGHVEGVNNITGGYGWLDHVEGRNNILGNIDYVGESHIEGEYNRLEYGENNHVEGAHNEDEDYLEFLYTQYHEIGGTYAKGYQPIVSFNRSSGRIAEPGDSQLLIAGAVSTGGGGVTVTRNKLHSFETTDPVGNFVNMHPDISGPRPDRNGYRISDDSNYVVYQVQREISPFVYSYSLFSVPLGGPDSASVQISIPPASPSVDHDVQDFVISPDSSTVVYRGDLLVDFMSELWSVPIGGGPSTKISKTLVSGGEVFSDYKINANSEIVVYRADADTDEVFELYSVPIGGGISTKINKTLVVGGDVFNFDITPDGNTVVYRGDVDTDNVFELYSVPIGGGTSIKLNQVLVGNVYDFKISPDGNTVVYRADADTVNVIELYSVPVGGGVPVKLNQIATGAFTLGTTITMAINSNLFTTGGLWQEFIATSTQTLDHIGVWLRSISTPGTVVFNLRNSPGLGSIIATSSSVIISETGPFAEYNVDYSGFAIVLNSGTKYTLEMVYVSGGTPGWGAQTTITPGLSNNAGRQFHLTARYLAPITTYDVQDFLISQDSSTVVFRGDMDTDGIFELYSVPIGGGSVTKLNQTFVSGGTINGLPVPLYDISPDSSMVVFGADAVVSGRKELYSVPIGGGSVVKLSPNVPSTSDDVWYFKISPDSSQVVYTVASYISNHSLWSTPIGGGTPIHLDVSTPGYQGFVSNTFDITPDSASVVFIQIPNDPYPIYSVPIGGGTANQIGDDTTRARSFRISNSGRVVSQNEERINVSIYETWQNFGNPMKTRENSVWLVNIEVAGRENYDPTLGSYTENAVCILQNVGGSITANLKSTYIHTNGTMDGSRLFGVVDQGSNEFNLAGVVNGSDVICHASIFATQLN